MFQLAVSHGRTSIAVAGCPRYTFAMSHAGVAAVVFDGPKQKFLLVKRRDVPVWVLPGGGIDPGESPETAAVREVFEESGVEVRILRKVAKYSANGWLSAETHVFECEVVGGVPGPSDETTAAGFFALEDYPAPVFPVHRNWVLDTLKNQQDVICKPVEGLDWFSVTRMIVGHPILVSRFFLSKLGRPWNTRSTPDSDRP